MSHHPRGRGYEAGSPPTVPDDGETQTQNRTMMSPTTALMLHSMNASRSHAGGGADGDDDDDKRTGRDGRARRPLDEVHRNAVRRDPVPDGDKSRRRPAGHKRHGDEDRPRGDMGPNESLYRREYDGYVTSAISQFAARSSTNLRRGGAALPDFAAMTASEKVEALEGVDRLLDRLSVGCSAPPSGVGASGVAAAASRGGGRRPPVLSADVGGNANREENGAYAYAAQYSTRSAGSETTMGNNNRTTATSGSVTTMGEGGVEGAGNDTTLLSGSVTTMGHGDGAARPVGRSPGRSILGRSLASRGDRSVSLLGDSMALLSDDDDGDDDDGDEDASDERDAPAVERARHASSRVDDRRSRLEIDDGYDGSVARSPHPVRAHGKRSAADSGGRGLRSRHRPSHDCDDGEVDDSLLGGGLGEDEHGDAVMFDDLGEDDGGFLSPIGRRSTFDGLDGAVAVTATVRAVVPGAAVGVGGAMIPAMASAPVEHSR